MFVCINSSSSRSSSRSSSSSSSSSIYIYNVYLIIVSLQNLGHELGRDGQQVDLVGKALGRLDLDCNTGRALSRTPWFTYWIYYNRFQQPTFQQFDLGDSANANDTTNVNNNNNNNIIIIIIIISSSSCSIIIMFYVVIIIVLQCIYDIETPEDRLMIIDVQYPVNILNIIDSSILIYCLKSRTVAMFGLMSTDCTCCSRRALICKNEITKTKKTKMGLA